MISEEAKEKIKRKEWIGSERWNTRPSFCNMTILKEGICYGGGRGVCTMLAEEVKEGKQTEKALRFGNV